MVRTKMLAYAGVVVLFVLFGVLLMGIFATPLEIVVLLELLIFIPIVLAIRFAGWIKAVIENAVGMRAAD